MKREFQDEDFEEFLKRNADNLRMKAPEKVWEKLSGELSKGRRRFGAGLSAFLLTTAVLGYLSVNNTSERPLLTNVPAASPAESGPAAESGSATPEAKVIPFSTVVERKQRNRQSETVQNPRTGAAAKTILPEQQIETTAGSDRIADQFTPTVTDDSPGDTNKEKPEEKPFKKPAFLSAYDASPLSIESVINTYRKKNRRFQTEFHFTPTISYRKLSENKSYLRANNSPFRTPPNYAALYNSVNNMVTHKPDIGFELGITEKYSVSQKLRIRAGLQFNVNRYDIKAFKSPYYLAAIALNTRGGSRIDSVFSISNYSNVDASSNKSSWLQNLSFQVSAPVGIELALTGNDKMQFGIATTVQPTYVLGDRAYLITTDYKSYTQVPWLLRRWNVNTALETFVSYQAGKTRWQVGPQVRYQLLSSFISNYPVKENLFDFGLKVGLSINK